MRHEYPDSLCMRSLMCVYAQFASHRGEIEWRLAIRENQWTQANPLQLLLFNHGHMRQIYRGSGLHNWYRDVRVWFNVKVVLFESPMEINFLA